MYWLFRRLMQLTFASQCLFWVYIIWFDIIAIRIVFGSIFSVQLVLFCYSIYERRKIIRHYQYQTGWMLVSQLAALVVLDENFSTNVNFVYFNTSENTYDEGIIEVEGASVSTTATLLSILQMTTFQFLYSSFRTLNNSALKRNIKYEPGIKWLEYVPSSTLQKIILYRVYGQVAQSLICVAGLNAACMVMAYFIERKLIDHYKFERVLKENGSFNDKMSDGEDDEEREDGDNGEEDDEKIKIFIKHPLQNDSDDFLTINFYKSANNIKLWEIKSYIERMKGVPQKNQRLFLNGKEMIDVNRDLDFYAVTNNSRIVLKEEDLIGYYLSKYHVYIIAAAFVFYSLFIYAPLGIYRDDRPKWVQIFLVGLILNDLSFPAIMIWKRKTLDFVKTDILYSCASLNSKNTMDYILILAAKRSAEGLIIGSLFFSFLFSFAIYKFSPDGSTNEIYDVPTSKRNKSLPYGHLS